MVLLQGFFLDLLCLTKLPAAFDRQKLVCIGLPVREAGRTREWIRVLPYGKGWLVARVIAITLRKEASSKFFMQVAAAVL